MALGPDHAKGIAAATVTLTVAAPIERVKLILQLQSASTQISTRTPYKGLIDAFIRLPQDNGALALWRGNLASILSYFPSTFLNFTFRDHYRQIIMPGIDKKTQYWSYFGGSLATGAAAGASTLCFTYPLDYCRTRLALDIGRGKLQMDVKGILDCLNKTIDKNGLPGVYKGFTTCIQGIIIYRALYFGLYDVAKDSFNDVQKTNYFANFLIAQCVTTIAGLVSYPFDTVRRRMMMQCLRKEREIMYKNTRDCWVKIYENEGGLKGFFKGGLTNILRGTGGAVILVVYDDLSNFISRQIK